VPPVLDAYRTHSESPDVAVRVAHFLSNMADAEENRALLLEPASATVVGILAHFSA
jgi:hypothetical protein